MKLGELFKAVVNAGLPMSAEVVVAPEGAIEGDATTPVAGAEARTLLKSGILTISLATGTAAAPTVRALVLRTRP